MVAKLTVEKRPDGWVVVDKNNDTYPETDPYDTKQEALEAKKGLEKFWKECT